MAKIGMQQYVRLLERAAAGQISKCVYCGNENRTVNDTWICTVCENINYAGTLRDPNLFPALDNVNQLIDERKYDEALAAYEKIMSQYNEPAYIYRYALLIMEQSNYEVSCIRYDRPGFMEENAVHRERASALHSKWKRIMNKALVACNDEIANAGGNQFLAYTLFILAIKLGKPKTAKRAIGIQERYNTPSVVAYENMVLSAELGLPHDTEKAAAELIRTMSFPLNAFYYLTWSMVKLGQYQDAAGMSARLSIYIQNDSLRALMQAIKAEREM